MADRHNLQTQLEHLQMKYIGTGHPDTTKYEWAVNQHRDSYASYISHSALLDYFSIAQGQTRQRVRHQMIHKMIRPCGENPVKAQQQ